MDLVDSLLPWLGGALLLMAAFYLVLPLVIAATQRLPARPEFILVEPGDLEAFDPGARRFLLSSHSELAKLGFGEAVFARFPNFAPEASASVLVMGRRSTGDLALALVQVIGGALPSRTLSVEFNRDYDDGSGEVLEFGTTNSPQLRDFPPLPGWVVTQTPSVTDVAELEALHRFFLGERAPAGRPVELPTGAEVLADHLFAIRYRKLAARGWLVPLPGDRYRLAALAAYRVFWGLLPPFKQLRRRALLRGEARVLAEFRRLGGED